MLFALQAIRDAFEKFMNMRENKPGELLAKYLDSTLRSGNRKCGSETEVESHLDNALALFRYLQVRSKLLHCACLPATSSSVHPSRK